MFIVYDKKSGDLLEADTLDEAKKKIIDEWLIDIEDSENDIIVCQEISKVIIKRNVDFVDV